MSTSPSTTINVAARRPAASAPSATSYRWPASSKLLNNVSTFSGEPQIPAKKRRAILGVLAWCGGTLLVTGSTAAAASSTPSKAAQQAFVKAVHSDYPQNPAIPASTMPAKTLLSLGGATCGLLMNGKSVKYVVNGLSNVTDGKQLPGEFVTAVVVEATNYLCPRRFS